MVTSPRFIVTYEKRCRWREGRRERGGEEKKKEAKECEETKWGCAWKVSMGINETVLALSFGRVSILSIRVRVQGCERKEEF